VKAVVDCTSAAVGRAWLPPLLRGTHGHSHQDDSFDTADAVDRDTMVDADHHHYHKPILGMIVMQGAASAGHLVLG